jgi:cell division septum initiation protein DivIVA
VARRYPLEPLLGIRRDRVERKATEHARAAEKSERLKAASASARAAREGGERALGEVRDGERRRLGSGGARVHDLQQGERHRFGANERIAALRVNEVEAGERARVAAGAREQARAMLARARADEKAVLEHARRFRAEQASLQERAQEDEAADRFTSVRRGARRV